MTTNAKANSPIVGGGVKKVIYTLNTVRKMGVKKAAKALNSNNTCKACALGMGGQMGGMTNELGEFPSVCNKSVQAQSSDTQPAIPAEIFQHSINELKELDGREMEHLGRLNTPLYKKAGEDHYQPLSWDEAMNIAITRLKNTDPHRSFFYSSGRSSNEAAFIFQLFARLFGTNNVNNCSYYCHQATSVALGSTIGTGTATIELEDLNGCDLIFVVGANPSSNHPRFIHKLKACRERGGEVIIINPAKEPGLIKFAVPKSPKSLLTGGSDIASAYMQPNIGSDVAVFTGIAKTILEKGKENHDFIENHTNGFDAFRTHVTQTSWDDILSITGLKKAAFEDIADRYARSNNAVFAWGMGLTHHLNGVENIECLANLAILRGMVGRPNAGLLPLRGHSNVQGIGTIGVKPVLADDVFSSIEQNLSVQLPTEEGMDTMACMQAAERGEIDAAIIMAGNLFAANPNSKWSQRALNKVGFKLFLTTTLNQGHVNGVEDGENLILPVTARDEEWSPTTQESMFNFVRLSSGGILRHDCVRPESVILCDIADGVLPNSSFKFAPFKNHSKTREAIAATVPGMEALADIDVAKKEFHITGRIFHTPKFKTPSGKAQFICCPIPAANMTVLQDYPFKLSSIRSEGQFNSIIYENHDTYRQTDNRWCVLMNATDIDALGIGKGQKVTVLSEHGVMHAVHVYSYDVPSGNILAYYPEANALTGTAVDARSKTPSFKNTAVRIDIAH
ncbi:FdhF/YdeP family oxidoreductase [Kordiimonas aquimaris]|uniref:FdhF/YdeP family oxidoreductase n=1 Tax=Kordiimonas aquimaris TaxID=707591 RepID=UPI0021D23DAD|nr:FdhF/YdeP family oxidoreductase [Kordiimonas aquimaris]